MSERVSRNEAERSVAQFVALYLLRRPRPKWSAEELCAAFGLDVEMVRSLMSELRVIDEGRRDVPVHARTRVFHRHYRGTSSAYLEREIVELLKIARRAGGTVPRRRRGGSSRRPPARGS